MLFIVHSDSGNRPFSYSRDPNGEVIEAPLAANGLPDLESVESGPVDHRGMGGPEFVRRINALLSEAESVFGQK
jgi:hypothetical protein